LNGAVRHTPELARIQALPRRQPQDEQKLADELTALLRAPGGTMQLRRVQALALFEIGTWGGAFLPIGVGEGKTLISLMAPYVLEAERVLLLCPASLIAKTEADVAEYSKDFLVPKNIRIMSYTMLGLEQSSKELETFNPDLIVADEVHKLKNRQAAVTKRVARWMHAHPETRFIGMSGTIMNKSLLDFGHILRWCLKDRSPIPKTTEELEEWASALDESVAGRPGDELLRLEPGALLQFATREPTSSGTDLERARRGFRARLVETPGVVSTAGDPEKVDCSLLIRGHVLKTKPITDQHFDKLRNEMKTPDDWDLFTGVDVWRHARELALGFHSIWDPRPPQEWLTPRKEWNAFVREVLKYSRTIESPLQVEMGCDEGRYPDDALRAWRAVEPTYTPNVVEVWHDDSALEWCVKWMKAGPGIVWTDHVFFARRLAERTGAPYYGESGLTDAGQSIERGNGKEAIIASARANREGRNIQKIWWRNLITSVGESAQAMQQLLGRTHRPKQPADEVIVDVLFSCREHAVAWERALASTIAVRDTVGGAPAKLLLADIDVPSPDAFRSLAGHRW
jgi:hypothetical protein